MVDEVGIIHMGGRIYDPRLGRFLQADPTVQFPDNTQSYNRYSYALNNPGIYVDPSGYGLLTVLESGFNALVDALPAIFNAAMLFAAYALAGPPGVALMATMLTKVETEGSWGQALKAGAIAGTSSFAFSVWGGPGAGDLFGLREFAINGLIGGITNLLSGENFGNGFLAAGVGAWMGAQSGWNAAGRIAGAAAIGGAVSQLSGGKFANGAVTATFAAAVGELAEHSEVSAEDKLNAQAASCAYKQSETCAGMSRIDYGGDPDSGFKWAAYQGSDGSGPVRVAFAGTDGLNRLDWKNNLSQSVGLQSKQYDQAVVLARKLNIRFDGNVVFTGHSLGGGLASAAAMATGGNAVTFNAAGLSQRYGGGANSGTIRAYYTRGDILSLIQDTVPGIPSASGQRVPLINYGVHQMSGVCQAMQANC